MTMGDLRKYLLEYLDDNMITHSKLAERVGISALVLRAILADQKEKHSELTHRKITKFLRDNKMLEKQS